MTNPRLTAIIVAVLFIIATAASVTAAALTDPILAQPDYLNAVAANASTMTLGVFFMYVAAGVTPGIPIALFPIFRRHSERAALAFLVARSFEAVLYLIGGIFMLVLVGLAQSAAGAGDGAAYNALGDLALKVQRAAFTLGPSIVFSISAIILSVILYQTRLVPRWISVWKFIGGAMLLLEGFLVMFEASTPLLDSTLFIPIAVNEMVFAIWLLVRGFDAAALSRLSAKVIHT